MATSRSELMTFQLWAKPFNIPLSIQIILFFPAHPHFLCLCLSFTPPSRKMNRQFYLWPDRQLTAFKVLWGNMFHMLGKTPSSSVNNFAMFVYNMHLWEVEALTMNTSLSSFWVISGCYNSVLLVLLYWLPTTVSHKGWLCGSLSLPVLAYLDFTDRVTQREQRSKQWDHCWGMPTSWQLNSAG